MSVTNVRELSTLLEISQTLSSALDFRTALTRVLELLEENHGTVSGTVTLLDDSGELRIEAAAGIPWQAQRRARFKVGEGVTGRVVESGRPVVVPRISQEPMFLDRTDVWKGSGLDELSFVSIPVPVDGKTRGSLGVTFPFHKDRRFED